MVSADQLLARFPRKRESYLIVEPAKATVHDHSMINEFVVHCCLTVVVLMLGNDIKTTGIQPLKKSTLGCHVHTLLKGGAPRDRKSVLP